MAKHYDHISEDLQDWIRAQHLFFVATAPLSAEGHVNLSPKGQDCLRILSPNRVAYLDLTGSGNETSAHLLENGRITIMFCALEDAPRILRLYGTGRVILPGDPAWEELSGLFPTIPGTRQIMDIEVALVGTSCGFAVPFYEYTGEREALIKWAENKGEEGLPAYWEEKNQQSLDHLPTHLSVNR